MTEERTEGQWDQGKGNLKEGFGKLTGDSSTENSGKMDQLKGNVEEKIGDVKDALNKGDDNR